MEKMPKSGFKKARLLCLLFCGLVIFLLGFSFGKTGRAYKHFREFTGEEAVHVAMLDEDWAYGIDAIGIVHLPSSSGPVCYFYFRETNSFIWNRFYAHPIPY
ncbi:MAG: hypothetical protein ABIF87_00060 [Pseudomonadota bacterium]